MFDVLVVVNDEHGKINLHIFIQYFYKKGGAQGQGDETKIKPALRAIAERGVYESYYFIGVQCNHLHHLAALSIKRESECRAHGGC